MIIGKSSTRPSPTVKIPAWEWDPSHNPTNNFSVVLHPTLVSSLIAFSSVGSTQLVTEISHARMVLVVNDVFAFSLTLRSRVREEMDPVPVPVQVTGLLLLTNTLPF
ncbi:hypothetical protein V6N13_104283 [Hibiscus sabdariffa]|uniref:Uncharacterized protein n=1 Tax=Hibiscus sabdariffa TaxID=183260 RepID=A0ABR2DI93_9ROSI